MTVLDDRVRLRGAYAGGAAELRSRALAVDEHPDDMEPHLDLPAFEMIRWRCTPERFRPPAARTGPWSFDASCLQRAIASAELARGDAGVLLACPGPGLAGVVVEVLGSESQKEMFYRRIADGRTWTFFAMTEPERGNDATALQTRLERVGSDGYRLHGVKRYIGNGARGGIGVVFARTGRGLLSIRAALVELPAPGWTATRLEMIGLRGAYLSELRFDGVPVPAEMLLGEHLPVSRRGMWGAIQTFHHVRILVASMAVGTALAMHDYVLDHRPTAPGAAVFAARLDAALTMVYEAADRVDTGADPAYHSSTAKLAATRLGVEVGTWAAAALGPASLLEHPPLEKLTRDVRAFEFMEGTSNIQRLQIARGHLIDPRPVDGTHV